MEKHVELLAPAGNYEAFLGALNAGADAVYLGGQQFGARAYADNFNTDEIIRALRVAHFMGKKVYLTVNTLLKEREMVSLDEYLRPFYEAGLDGVIVQDFGVFCYIRDHFPGLPLHVSTQMTVTGARGASLLKEQGAVRIVPARELSLEEVRKIREEAGVEVECFIHGAMCYCYSGQCLFSSILGGRSGNRGRCAQPCRLPYEIYDGKNRLSGSSYPLSLKDMCTLEYLPALLEAGIDSFKIEGRMKRPEYAAGVTAVYRKYIDLYYRDGAAGYRVAKEDMDRLRGLYIRSEIQTGYYERHNGKEMITPGDPGYTRCDETTLKEIRERYIREPEKMLVRLKAQVKVGEPIRLSIMKYVTENMCCASEEKWVEIAGEIVQPAKKAPLSEEEVRKRLSKTGDSFLRVEECEISMTGEGFLPVRAINELRRSAVEAFESAISESRGTDMKKCLAKEEPEKKYDREDGNVRLGRSKKDRTAVTPFIDAVVSTCEQLQAVLKWGGCRRIYIESDLFSDSCGEVVGIIKETAEVRDAVNRPVFYLALPYILRKRDEAYLEQLFTFLAEENTLFSGFLARNLEGLAYSDALRKRESKAFDGFKLTPDAGLYCFNTDALRFWGEFSEEITMPYELNAGEAAHLVRGAGERGMHVNMIVYGRIPMMVTANCLQKTAGFCSKGKGTSRQLTLKDRLGQMFPVEINCRHCYNIIYNCVPYSLHGAKKERERISADALRYDFTTESGEQCKKILEGAFPFVDYTTGHCRRGVE